MRLSSAVFPFASHMKHGYSLNDDPSIVELLARVGALANKWVADLVQLSFPARSLDATLC